MGYGVVLPARALREGPEGGCASKEWKCLAGVSRASASLQQSMMTMMAVCHAATAACLDDPLYLSSPTGLGLRWSGLPERPPGFCELHHANGRRCPHPPAIHPPPTHELHSSPVTQVAQQSTINRHRLLLQHSPPTSSHRHAKPGTSLQAKC